MSTACTVVAWVSLAFVVYTYLGYPLCLALLDRLRRRPVASGEALPRVAVLICVRNEADRIAPKLATVLGGDYPADRIAVFVADDASTDGTAEAIEAMGEPRVHLVAAKSQQGKPANLNVLAELAAESAEVLVFTDARQPFEPECLRRLLAPLADETVGGVTGQLVFVDEDHPEVVRGMGLYWRYETWIRQTEGRLHSVVGGTGAIYAIRAELFQPFPDGIVCDDMYQPLAVVLGGRRFVSEPCARVHDHLSRSIAQEFRRKVRTLGGNFQLMRLLPDLLRPWRNPLWWQYVSHKLFRLLVPYAMVALLAASIGLAASPGWAVMVGLQVLFYFAAAIGALQERLGREGRLPRLCYSIVQLNLAAVVGLYRYLTGRLSAGWK